MQFLMSLFVGLLLSVSVSAESLLEGRVRLESGQPAAGVQVRLFDLTNLHQSVGTTTDETGHFTLSLPAAASGSALPQGFALGQNYPNPFNPSTIIPYQIPTATHVRLEVFNVLGQRVATLVDAERPAGFHAAKWDATDAAGQAGGAGVYIYRLVSGGATTSRRMVLIDGQAGTPATGAAGPELIRSTRGQVEADGQVWGLTVSGAGVVAYVNPAFRVGVDAAEIVLEAASGIPRMKRTAGGILGDVDNDGLVDVDDLLYVALYSEDSSIALPNNGDISLGDLNKDGTVDFADAMLLIRYLADPSDSALPAGIGEPMGATTTTASASQQWKLYWTDNDTNRIQRANLDGSQRENLVYIRNSYPYDIALDVAGGKMYWTALGSIRRANLDGSRIEKLVSFVIGSDNWLYGIALDVAGGKMYWTAGRKIQRANLDGSAVEDLVTTGLSRLYGIALDVASDKMYWTAGRKIQRANLDGSAVEDLVTTGLSRSYGIALDVASDKMYWTDRSTGDIQCASLDGSYIEKLANTREPTDIALDVAGGKMYWADTYRSHNYSANLDGSGVKEFPTSSSRWGESYGIALGFVPVVPDLVVQVSVSDNRRTPGQSFILSATVRNQGGEQAAATTLRYYRSDDATISTQDTRVGTDEVGALDTADTSAEFIRLKAPSIEGKYYYGACVESVSGESNTDNNCSSADVIFTFDDGGEYTPVDWIQVTEDGGIEAQIGFTNIVGPEGCISFNGSTFNGVKYYAFGFKWVMRKGEDSEWVNMPGIAPLEQLCGIVRFNGTMPTISGEYRPVLELHRGERSGKYTSGNMLVVDSNGNTRVVAGDGNTLVVAGDSR